MGLWVANQCGDRGHVVWPIGRESVGCWAFIPVSSTSQLAMVVGT